MIPAILYERHKFSKSTKHKYDKDYTDVSWPIGYRKKDRLGKAVKKMADGRVDAEDIYGSHAASYLRLINAYKLDKNSALVACSWGKFQILGDNYSNCGEKDVTCFVQKMCTSESSQIGLLAGFISHKSQLLEAVRIKDWAGIALNYNGPDYRTYEYDSKLRHAYEKLKNRN